MAPKRRGRKVVSSVVKTKVVKETVEVATTILPDSDSLPADTQPEPEVVDVHGSTAVHVVEVTTPDGEAPAAKKSKKGGQGQDASPKSPEPPVVEPVSVQSQETQEDPYAYKDQPEQRTTEKPQIEKKPASEGPETPRQKKPKPGRKSTALKVEGSKDGRGRRRRGSRPEMGYKRFVYRGVRQVHPDLGASGKTMEILDMMMADMFERLAEEAARLAKHARRATLSSREVQSAVRLVLPGELAGHAISEGTKAVTKYMSRD
jgi:histone H2B